MWWSGLGRCFARLVGIADLIWETCLLGRCWFEGDVRFVTSGWVSGIDAGRTTPGRFYIYRLCICVFDCLIVVLFILSLAVQFLCAV
jgi:NADH:ubiquinone oxidoreductase subunit 3 (subunit A)